MTIVISFHLLGPAPGVSVNSMKREHPDSIGQSAVAGVYHATFAGGIFFVA